MYQYPVVLQEAPPLLEQVCTAVILEFHSKRFLCTWMHTMFLAVTHYSTSLC